MPSPLSITERSCEVPEWEGHDGEHLLQVIVVLSSVSVSKPGFPRSANSFG